MPDIVVRLRYTFPREALRWIEHHSGDATVRALREQINALVECWVEDLSADYEAYKEEQIDDA